MFGIVVLAEGVEEQEHGDDVPSVAFGHVLHQVLHLQHSAGCHLQASFRNSVETADNELDVLVETFPAGIDLYSHPFQRHAVRCWLHSGVIIFKIT